MASLVYYPAPIISSLLLPHHFDVAAEVRKQITFLVEDYTPAPRAETYVFPVEVGIGHIFSATIPKNLESPHDCVARAKLELAVGNEPVAIGWLMAGACANPYAQQLFQNNCDVTCAVLRTFF